jgi:hypothetical protein
LSTAPPGKKNVLKRTPIITGDKTIGMKKRNRKTFQPRTFSYTKTAVTSDAARISGTDIKKMSAFTNI